MGLRAVWSAVFFCASIAVLGQTDIGSATLSGVWQATYLNPAMFPEHRVVVSLPGLHGHLSSNSFHWGDLISDGASGRKRLDPDRMIAALKDQNVLRVQSELPILGVGISGDNWWVGAGVQVRSVTRLEFPRTLAELLWKGNAGFIGETIDFGLVLNGSIFNESFIGLAVRSGPKLSIGARLKILNGLFNVATPNSRLSLRTGADAYALLLNADYRLNTTADLTYSGLDSFLLGDIRLGVSRLFGDNPGIAMDFGIRYQNGPLVLQASILDVGRLNWKKETRSLELNGTFEFTGVDIFQQWLGGNGSSPIRILDSIEAQYEVRQSRAVYQTWLPARIFGAATFDFNDFIQGTATLLVEVEGGDPYTALAIGGRLKAGRWATLGMQYALRHGMVGHLGLNAVLNAGPLQIVAATDYLGAWVAPEKARAANLRLGVNLTFGHIKVE